MNRGLYLILILSILTSCLNQNYKPICEIVPDNYNYGYKDQYGYTIYHNLEQAKLCSESTGRPILIMFASWRCLSDRHTIWAIFEDENVKKIINENYLLTMLYVDDTTKLTKIDSSVRTYNGKVIETVGVYNLNIEIVNFQVNAMPLYVIVDYKMNTIVEPIGYVNKNNKKQFTDFLMKGINK